MNLKIMQGGIFTRIKEIPDNSIDLCITSPPYWGLRDYGVEGQLGAEPTMEKYLENTMLWVKEVFRVLKPSGSFVLNIGDCFVGGAGRWGSAKNFSGIFEAQKTISKPCIIPIGHIYKPRQLLSVSSFAYCKIISETDFLCRGEHIWAKPNVPSPIRSRLKHSHEKLFWFVKDVDKYYFDKSAWMKKVQKTEENMTNEDKETIEHSWRIIPVGAKQTGFENGKKPKSLHIAPYPENLIAPYIQSLSPPEGTVLDTFLGSGTTMRVALVNQRNCVGIELKKEYIEYAKKRLNWGSGLNIDYEVLEG